MSSDCEKSEEVTHVDLDDRPDVSVIIPAYNALPFLHRTLESLVTQTIGTESLEVIVVDDGSTDGTGAVVDEWAARHPGLFHVIHAEGSGGPATPRNTALDRARGRYVFFLDADDFLGTEALARLVAAGDEQGSDIVLGKMVSTGERAVPESMFQRTDLDADLFESRIYWTLTALKLFRRDLIEDHRLRFPTHMPVGSDQPFTAMAYLRAKKVTVLADYDYYHVVLRGDGQHVTLSGPLEHRVDIGEIMCDLLAREVPDPTRRAPLLARHFQVDFRLVMVGLCDQEPDVQRALLARVAQAIRTHLSPDVMERLGPALRVVYHLAERELLDEVLHAVEQGLGSPYDIAIDAGRAYGLLPYFRDPVVHVPDELYDVTDRLRATARITGFRCGRDGILSLVGTAGFRHAVGTPEVRLVLRSHKDPSLEHVLDATHVENDGGFELAADLLAVSGGEPLTRGGWDLFLKVSQAGVEQLLHPKTAEPDDGEAASLTTSFAWASGPDERTWTFGARQTRRRTLRLEVGARSGKPERHFTDWVTSWEGADLMVRCAVAARVDSALALVLRGPEKQMRVCPGEVRDGVFEGRVSVDDLKPGRWKVRLRVGAPPAAHSLKIQPAGRVGIHQRRRGLSTRTVQVVASPPTLTLHVTEENRVRNVARRLTRR